MNREIPARAHGLQTITVLGHSIRLFRSPLEGPDYPWVVLVDLLVSDATTTDDFREDADRLADERPDFARYMLTEAGREMLVSSFVVAIILNYQAEAGWDLAQKALIEFEYQMGEVFASQYDGMSHDEFYQTCIIAAVRHNQPGHA